MALITISETARLTGKNRTTIYKYINSGKLSVVTGVDGSKKIDTSEVLRVFPDCKIVEKQQRGDNVTQQHATQKQPVFGEENPHFWTFRRFLAVSGMAVVRERSLMLKTTELMLIIHVCDIFDIHV